jgi:hypothetical protein
VRLSQAALDVGGEDPGRSAALLRLAEEHQAGLAAHLEDPGRSAALLRLAEEHQAGLAAHLEEAAFQNILTQFQAIFQEPYPFCFLIQV